MIHPASIQEVLEKCQIDDVVRDFVTLQRRGSNLIGLCPFHNEKSPSFSVSPSKNIFKCFGCGKGGDSLHFVMELENLSFPDAIRYLAQKYKIELDETVTSEVQKDEQKHLESLYLINDFAVKFYAKQLWESERGRNIGLSYFKHREFREEIINEFKLGFAPESGNALTTEAVKMGYSLEYLQKLGLTNSQGNDFFRGRVMFPIFNMSGKVIAFAGRILIKDTKAPKYINSPETEIYVKSKTLFGMNFARKMIQKEDECILTEGYTDVLSLHQAGISNVVAAGDAVKVTTVDMSNTYLQWAEKNMHLNGFKSSKKYDYIREDILDWIPTVSPSSYDLIILDPPTFSNSKKMLLTWDVQRDHVALINQIRSILSPGGILYFSNNYKKFKLNIAEIEGFDSIEELTDKSIPEDFERSKPHVCFRLINK